MVNRPYNKFLVVNDIAAVIFTLICLLGLTLSTSINGAAWWLLGMLFGVFLVIFVTKQITDNKEILMDDKCEDCGKIKDCCGNCGCED